MKYTVQVLKKLVPRSLWLILYLLNNSTAIQQSKLSQHTYS